MTRFEIHKPSRVVDDLPTESRFVWINVSIHDDQQLVVERKIKDFLEEKLETEGLMLVMGHPGMKRWLFKWVR